jgi:hypothetical protein
MRHGKSILILGALLAVGSVVGASTAQAINPATISVTVTIQNLSVAATGPIAFGTVSSGSVTVSTDSSEVTNDGNISETYSLDVSEPVGWTAVQAATGVDEFCLHAQFNSAQPTAVSFTYANHALTTAPVAASGTQFAGDQDGESVAASGVTYLWLKFEAPATSTLFTQQTITVTLTAAAG